MEGSSIACAVVLFSSFQSMRCVNDVLMHRSQDSTWSRSTAGSGALTMKAWIWPAAGMGIGYFARAKIKFVLEPRVQCAMKSTGHEYASMAPRLAQDLFTHHFIPFHKIYLQSFVAGWSDNQSAVIIRTHLFV